MEHERTLKVENVTLRVGQPLPERTTQTHADRLVGTILDDKIRIEELIGQGGMSIVYRGTHMVLNRTVAIKVILPSLGFDNKAVMRLQQEAKAAFSLSHPNLASVHDVSVTSEGLPYLVMDFAGGETLADMIKRGPLEPTRAIEIFSQVCAGLRAAHAQGVIHRDIKPGNIMVEHLADGSEQVKIVDFGIAKKVTEDVDSIQKLTRTGEVFGTPLYMSPEQCHGEKLDQRSDIYSLGCVFYEALTGMPPFKGESAVATILLHLGKQAPTPGKEFNLSSSLVGVLHRCMEKNSQDRYQSMDELDQDLQAIKEGGKTAKKYVKKPPISSKKIIAALAFVCFAVVICFVYHEATNQGTKQASGYDTIQDCNEHLARNSNDRNAYFHRAGLYLRKHEYSIAVADYTSCIKDGKAPAPVFYMRAWAYTQLHNYKEALDDCNHALTLEPGGEQAMNTRAHVFYLLHQNDQSVADCNAYLKKNPSDATVLGLRAQGLINLGRYQEALNDCTQAIKICDGKKQNKMDDFRSVLYRDRSIANNWLHNSDDAVADATEAVRLTNDPEAYSQRAFAQLRLKQFDKALSDADNALRLKSIQPLAFNVKAAALEHFGKLEEALEVCNQTLTITPDEKRALFIRSSIYKKMGKLDLAKRDSDKLDDKNFVQFLPTH